MKNNNTKNVMRHLLFSGLVAAGIFASWSVQAAPILAVDLTVNNSGTINGVDFVFDQQQPTGTGVLNPFLRIQERGNEQGYNTNALNVFDNKPPAGFTHDLKFSDLVSIGGFYSFVLDIAEGGGKDSLLSLDGLKFFKGAGSQSSETTDVNGDANGIVGTLLYNMDATVDNYVLLDANRLGNPGNGVSDMLLKVPDAIFSGVNPNDNIILWSRFGLLQGANPGASENSFEEWASLTPKNGGSQVPEPNLITLFGMGLVGMASLNILRKRKAH